MKIISFINMKGGVGKTTSVVEIGTILANEHDKKVLIIDLDPQTNASFSLMGLDEWDKVKDNATIADVLGMNKAFSSRDDEYDINRAIVKNVCDIQGLDLIPSHIELTFLDLDLSGQAGRENILSSQLEKCEEDYDYVLIDCPPNLTIAPQNALVVSNYIIVPVSPEFYAAIGLPLLSNRISQLKKRLPGCTVEILGVIFTQVRQTLDHEHHLNEIRKTCNDDLDIATFQTVIPFTTRISESAKWNKPATLANPNANGIQAYKNLTQELLLTLESDEEE
ncbi:ParA family protein [Rhodohalobacter halophilus]|uniref:ParA family protein n=1 Tax=Rhodohalobacter halophilus TaxID=1812810 RepID=UPI00083F822C|nr:AAA family ATPase [Rhodohalobacter halophilus]